MRKYFLAIAAIISCNFSFACGNEYFRADMPLEKGNLNLKFLLEHETTNESGELPYWSHGYNVGMSSETQYFLDEYNKTKDYKYLSDYAWELVKEGKAKQAIIILDSLLKTHLNEYNILANLGTAYEIVGNNAKALELLTKAVAINRNSHYGSEWIHLNILKHNINKKGFPLERIIDLDIDKYSLEWSTDAWSHRIPADSLLKSIAYQLHERIGFIAPKDKVIGRLIFDFATIIAKTKSKEEALPFYDYAMYYDNELYSKIVKAKRVPLSVKDTTTNEEIPSKRNLFLLIFGILALTVIAFIVGRLTAKKITA